MEISVIMSVYNTEEEFLRESINSILGQTFKDFEFIIISDGSNEKTLEILDSYKDERIVRIKNEENIGLTKSLNKGLRVARGKYIARMDADDVSYKDRLEKQYHYMEKHKEITILGARTTDGNRIQKYDGKIATESRKVRMLFGNSGIAHPTAFIRSSFLKQNNILYDEQIKKTQDYRLWIECLKRGAKMTVYPQVLLLYRIHKNQISKDTNGEQEKYKQMIRRDLITEILPEITEKELEQFLNLKEKILSVEEFLDFCMKIEEKNKEKKMYDSACLHYELHDFTRRLYKEVKPEGLGYYVYRIKRTIDKMR